MDSIVSHGLKALITLIILFSYPYSISNHDNTEGYDDLNLLGLQA